jgi:RNA polymerase sigma-70 factor, ECF subfamily
MAPGLDAEIERVLEAYGAELYGFLMSLVGEAEAGEVFSQVVEDLGARVPMFSSSCNTRTLLYRLARHAVRFRRSIDEVALARTAQHRRKPATDRVSALRESLEPDDRIMLTLRVDRELPWDDVARVMLEAEDPDAATLARETERLRERFVVLKVELRQRANDAAPAHALADTVVARPRPSVPPPTSAPAPKRTLPSAGMIGVLAIAIIAIVLLLFFR